MLGPLLYMCWLASAQYITTSKQNRRHSCPHLPPLVKLLPVLDAVLLAQRATKGPHTGKHKSQLEQALVAFCRQVLGAEQALQLCQDGRTG